MILSVDMINFSLSTGESVLLLLLFCFFAHLWAKDVLQSSPVLVQVQIPNSWERKSNFSRFVEIFTTGLININWGVRSVMSSTSLVARNLVPEAEGIISEGEDAPNYEDPRLCTHFKVYVT